MFFIEVFATYLVSGSVLTKIEALEAQQPPQQPTANDADVAAAAAALYYCAMMMHL